MAMTRSNREMQRVCRSAFPCSLVDSTDDNRVRAKPEVPISIMDIFWDFLTTSPSHQRGSLESLLRQNLTKLLLIPQGQARLDN